MSDPTQQLEKDHQEILGHLEAIRTASYNKDVAVRELRLAKGKILAHLGTEEKAIYTPMRANPTCKATAEDFQSRMGPISIEVLAFFERYDLTSGKELGLAFSKDLGGLVQHLRSRIRQEEDQLYPLYRRTFG